MRRFTATLFILCFMFIFMSCTAARDISQPLQDVEVVNNYIMSIAVTHPEWIPTIIEKSELAETMFLDGISTQDVDAFMVKEINDSDMARAAKLTVMISYITLKDALTGYTEGLTERQIDIFWLNIVYNIREAALRHQP